MRLSLLLILCVSAWAGEGLYFPPTDGGEWARVEPDAAGWDGAALEEALDFAGERRSTAVVVLFHGKILAERGWEVEPKERTRMYRFLRVSDEPILEDIASAQKSVTAELFGVARSKGLIELDDRVSKHLGAGWSKASPAQEAKITMRHLLTMTSGLSDRLRYQADAGAKWRYNTPAYQLIMRVLVKVTGLSTNELTGRWLTAKIGMRDTRWRERPGMNGMLGLTSTARDMARFGLLMLAEGVWNGETVLPDREYVRASVRPTQERNRGYGYLWWLNGHPVLRGGKTIPMLIPTAPRDLYAAQGALQRKAYVVPSLGLVVTRTGDNGRLKGESSFNNELWRRLMRAAPR